MTPFLRPGNILPAPLLTLSMTNHAIIQGQSAYTVRVLLKYVKLGK